MVIDGPQVRLAGISCNDRQTDPGDVNWPDGHGRGDMGKNAWTDLLSRPYMDPPSGR